MIFKRKALYIVMVFLEIKEYKKQWNKQYREENREKLNEKDRKYYQENKERLSEKIPCECGCIIRRDSMSKHKKTNKHLELMTKK